MVGRVIVVLNKIDTLESDEGATVAAFVRGVLAEPSRFGRDNADFLPLGAPRSTRPTCGAPKEVAF
jgi:hypothetical protein